MKTYTQDELEELEEMICESLLTNADVFNIDTDEADAISVDRATSLVEAIFKEMEG